MGHLSELGPASVKVAVLLRKQGRQVHAVHADFVGFEIPDEFVVGYGLDYNDEFRQLPHIAVLPPEPRNQESGVRNQESEIRNTDCPTPDS